MARCVLILILYFFASVATGCECVSFSSLKKARLANYQASPWVFTAEVVEIGELTKYRLRVIEVFKGLSVPVFLNGEMHDNCSMEPKGKGEMWLIYTAPDTNGRIDLSSCSLSRDLKSSHIPIPIFGLIFNEQPTLEESHRSERSNVNDMLYRSKSALVDEIHWLRSKRPIWVSKHPLEDITGCYSNYGLSEL